MHVHWVFAAIDHGNVFDAQGAQRSIWRAGFEEPQVQLDGTALK